MRFAFVESWRHLWPVEAICRVMRVSTRGYRSWRTRPMCHRDRTDMKILAHIREQYPYPATPPPEMRAFGAADEASHKISEMPEWLAPRA